MRLVVSLLCSLALGACVQSGEPIEAPGSAWGDGGYCQDRDLDGYGEGCPNGGDCDDLDREVHIGCARCAVPQEGCACDDGAKPVSCFLSPSVDSDGVAMCHEGTRYCRGGEWSACESIVSYARDEVIDQNALVTPGTVSRCSDCSANCFRVRDNLDPVDAGLTGTSSNVTSSDGGLSLVFATADAGSYDSGIKPFDPSKCVIGAAPDKDCDGIPDTYDPNPTKKPFETANPTLFLDIAPGQTGTGVVNLKFYLNSADVYFLVDQTGSMGEERANLQADLKSGDFIQDANRQCSDIDFDLKPNDELKEQGIIGAVRCIIRDANFGVGYFREIPFDPYANADSDAVTFNNLQDITGNIDSVFTAVSSLTPKYNIDWPEAASLALNALVSGRGYYFGSGAGRPNVAAKTGCASSAFGYPCFRNNAIPIVVMFTDAPFHEGPSPRNLPYDRSKLTFTNGTPTTTTVINTNDALGNARVIGDVVSGDVTFSGNTTGLKSDFGADAITCGSTDKGAPDATYKFTLPYATTLKAVSTGNTTVSIITGRPAPTTTATVTYPATNDTVATAYDFGNVLNKVVQGSGDSGTLKSDYSPNDVSCGAVPGAKDATFTFSLSEPARMVLDTTGSSYGASLALFSGAPATVSYTSLVSESKNTNDTLASAYAVGDLVGKHLGFSGDSSSTTAIKATYTGAALGCSSASTDAAPDAVYSFSLSKATRVRISTEDTSFATTVALTGPGTHLQPTTIVQLSTNNNGDSSSAKDMGTVMNGSWFQYLGDTSKLSGTDYTSTLIGCNADSSAKDAVFKFTVDADRTVVIDTAGSSFNTVLSLFKTSVSGTYVKCNDNASSDLETSSISQLVTAGTTYYVVVKGRDRNGWNTEQGTYTLNIRDSGVTQQTVLQCDYNSGPGSKSLIEADLQPGSYNVIVKGKASTDNGPYKLILRDVVAVPTGRLACASAGSSITSDLNAGTYTVVLKANVATGSGAYKLKVSHINALACGTGTTGASTTLAAGTYYAVVKGKTSSDVGPYTLTIGPSSFVPPTWDETLGLLQQKSVHVIPVLSCRDDSAHGDEQGDCVTARIQATALANGTNTLGTNNQPLVFDIDKNGDGLSTQLVDGIRQLAHYLEMDVEIQVVFAPDANPGFGFEIQAIDAPGDGCSSMVGNKHVGCAPGATPRFDLRFTNPDSPSSVPLHPTDPKGGYNFRAELIGDGKFIVDQVPIYIVPSNVTKPSPQVAMSGSYWQTISASKCTGTLAPDWNELTWKAAVPEGTKVSFGLCASDKASDLTTCSPRQLCTITGGAACTTNSQCPNGFCSEEKNCQTVTGGLCGLDADCSTGATCRSGKCTYAQQPIYVGGILGGANYTANLRMQIDMIGNQTKNTSPTVYDWALSYLCNSAL